MGQNKNPANVDKEGGALYRLDTNGDVTKQVDKVTISNGLAWTADNKVMYFIDSIPRKVYAFDFDLETGAVSKLHTTHFFNLFADFLKFSIRNKLHY